MTHTCMENVNILSQRWQKFMLSYGVTRQQWVNYRLNGFLSSQYWETIRNTNIYFCFLKRNSTGWYLTLFTPMIHMHGSSLLIQHQSIIHALSVQELSEWVIKFNSLSRDSGQRGPYSPYKPCNHSLYNGIIIFTRIDYRKFSNIRRTQSQNINVSCLVLQLSLPNPLKPGVKFRMKM